MQDSTSAVIYNILSCSPHECNENMDFLWFFLSCFFSLMHTFLVFYRLFSPSRWLFSWNVFHFSFASCLSKCLSLCLGCVWPCPSLPPQEVVSRLIESRLRSLELNTCLEELLFNCSSHTDTHTHTHIKHIHAAFDLTWSHSLVLALFLPFIEEERWMRKRGRYEING